MNVPKRLYKYRAFNVNSLRLLTDAEVYYADPRSFNDPLDCSPTIAVDVDRPTLEKLCYKLLLKTRSADDAKSEINEFRYSSSEYGDDRTNSDVEDYLMRMIAGRIKRLIDAEMGGKGVLSFAQKWNCPLMWSHYADEHRGICIEYDTTQIAHKNVAAVKYRNPRSIRASDILAWKLEGSAEAEQRVYETYFFAKSPQWRYESEWRDITNSNGAVDEGFAITAIHFGLRCDHAVVTTIVSLLVNKLDIKLYEIYPLDESFGLKRRLVDHDEIVACGVRTSAMLAFKDVVLDKGA